MKRFATVLSIAMLSYGVSQAQNTIIAGKITDKKGNAIPHATVRLARKAEVVELRSDNLGLYQSQPLPAGKYKVTAHAGSHDWKNGKLVLGDNNGKKVFYEMHAKGKHLKVAQTDRDFFAEARATPGPDIQLKPRTAIRDTRVIDANPVNRPVIRSDARAGEAVPQLQVK